MDITMMAGGEAGQGVATVGFLLARVFSRGGYYVFADQDYESRIRGGHNFFRVRISDKPVAAISEDVNLLIALNEETINRHLKKVAGDKTGGVIFDRDGVKAALGGVIDLGISMEQLGKTEGGQEGMANSVATGAALGVVGFDFSLLEQAIAEQFSSGGEKIVNGNIRAARAGYDYARKNLPGKVDLTLPVLNRQKRMLLHGNDAIALGALAAGCKFMTSYPMTPATSIMEYLAGKADEFGMVVLQAEDEISAANMTIGASFTGVRAMAATSGGGFCLMVEGLGLAGMTETPMVIVESHRPGPSTGLPTRTEQGDLEFIIHASQSEFPRFVIAPVNIEDAFYATVQAFNLAERYQTPVILISDQYQAASYGTTDKFDLSTVTIDRGLLADGESIKKGYKRHAFTESGISPRAFPGKDGAVVLTTGDEHDEEGHIEEDAGIRTLMVEKRLRKLEQAKHDMTPPLGYGLKDAELLLVGWGSSFGAIREAVDILNQQGISARMICLRDIFPFPAESFAAGFGAPRQVFMVEQNATGQMAHFIRAETGIHIENKILRYDGRPITPGYIVERIKKEVG
ncbi:MAG: 2-oxoacid:acceptor oxidoreductase subunit alpha [Dehalococcoidia bacterium]|nr:2-oxoacid:acceptor oxidoreductase subunit alpha [Dehalococcoidia bacterium]